MRSFSVQTRPSFVETSAQVLSRSWRRREGGLRGSDQGLFDRARRGEGEGCAPLDLNRTRSPDKSRRLLLKVRENDLGLVSKW